MSDRKAIPAIGLVVGVVLVAIGASLATRQDPVGVLRVLAAVILLALPGFAVSYALVPARAIDLSRRATVVIAGGVGSLVLGGLLLDQVPGGIQAATWVVFVLATTALGLGIAVWRGNVPTPRWPSRLRDRLRDRRARSGPSGDVAARRVDASSATAGTTTRRHGSARTIRSMALPVLAIAVGISLAGLSLAVARAGALNQDRAQTFTEFWVHPTPGTVGSVDLGITSHEAVPAKFSIVVDADGARIGAPPDVTLAPGETHVASVAIPAGTKTIDAHLYRDGGSEPYRQVSLVTGSTS